MTTPPPSWAENSRTLSPGEPLHGRSPDPGTQPPVYPLLQFWRPGHGCLLTHLCRLQHCEPLEVFMGGVRGAAAPIARPHSSLSCILSRERADCEVTVLQPRTFAHLTAHRLQDFLSNPLNPWKRLEAPRVLWWLLFMSCCPSPENGYLHVCIVTLW